MTPDPPTLLRVGAWGQFLALALLVVSWAAGWEAVFLLSCLGYAVVTMVGIAGIARAESVVAGPFAFPFVLPGFVPLYYFATRADGPAADGGK
jgi:hypothetical protein